MGGWGGQPETFPYQVLGEAPETKNFQIYPCGQTVMRNSLTNYGDPVLPCKGSPGPLCFEDRLEGAPTSRIFLVVPRDYSGGERRWNQEGVEFVALPISGAPNDDISVITATRLRGTHHPAIQRFVFSVRDGLLTAVIGDGTDPDTRIYVLEGRGGIFANHGEGSFALNRK
jgi:hypothetical protein